MPFLRGPPSHLEVPQGVRFPRGNPKQKSIRSCNWLTRAVARPCSRRSASPARGRRRCFPLRRAQLWLRWMKWQRDHLTWCHGRVWAGSRWFWVMMRSMSERFKVKKRVPPLPASSTPSTRFNPQQPSTMAAERRVYPVEEAQEAGDNFAAPHRTATGEHLIIDNGCVSLRAHPAPPVQANARLHSSSTLRAGWSGDADPRVVTPNFGARYRDRRTNRTIMLAGNEAYADATSKTNIKSPFEGDVVCNFDQMVRVELCGVGGSSC